VSHAGTRYGKATSIPRVPSPLNGEKVAEGRMRCGYTHDFGLRFAGGYSQLTSSPLTLTLSPLRGEGTAHVSTIHALNSLSTPFAGLAFTNLDVLISTNQ